MGSPMDVQRAASPIPNSLDLRESAEFLYEHALARPAASLASGLYGSTADLFEMLDTWTRAAERIGIPRGGAFETVARDQRERSTFYAERGRDPDSALGRATAAVYST